MKQTNLDQAAPGGVSRANFGIGIGIVVAMAATTSTGAKRGRKPKGRRLPATVKFPEEHKHAYEQRAADLGIPLCDYVALVMAEHHGYEVPSYLDTHKGQEALPISA